MKAINIKWDRDGEVIETLPKAVVLPAQFNRENYLQDGKYNVDDMLDDISDWLSDEYGFCHYGFEVVDECNIREIAYELYKQDWIDSQTTREMRLDALREYYLYQKECINNNFALDSFEEWISEVGYGSGSLYVCYEEFCDTEYRDEGYMRILLSDNALIALYHADIENEKEPAVEPEL